VQALERGDEVEVDLAAGEIRTAKGTFSFPPLPEAVMAIFDAGGLIPYVRRQLGIEA
jgi:3-isopropylmalate dehydratase small subunit